MGTQEQEIDERQQDNETGALNSAVKFMSSLANKAVGKANNRDVISSARDYVFGQSLLNRNEQATHQTVSSYNAVREMDLISIINSYIDKNSKNNAKNVGGFTSGNVTSAGVTVALQNLGESVSAGKYSPVVQDFFKGVMDGNIKMNGNVVTYSREDMGALNEVFEEMFGRFATSFSYCDNVVNQILQNGDLSGVHSPTYGQGLKDFWEKNAGAYENFPTLAGNWVDLIWLVCTKNDEAIQQVMEQYSKELNG